MRLCQLICYPSESVTAESGLTEPDRKLVIDLSPHSLLGVVLGG